LGELEVAEDDVQRAGADGLVHHGYKTAPVLEVYGAVEPGVEAIGAGLNMIANTQQHQTS
jgi:hypothetical protein